MIEEVKEYVYNNDIENLYINEDDENIYMKRKLNINKILGGTLSRTP